jgi:hypothetical protein
MNQVAFLLDENIPPAVAEAIRIADPAITLLQVGHEPDAPVKGTLDPELLVFAENHGLTLVTFDKRSMTGHVVNHLVVDRHTWGVLIFPKGNQLSAGKVAEELLIIWACSQKEEWIDQIVFLPY